MKKLLFLLLCTAWCGASAQTPICGYPGYLCGRTDANTKVINSLTIVPPQAGPNRCYAGKLSQCGNLTGINYKIVENDYHYAHLTRVTDITDVKSGCIPLAGLGGAASHNVFSSDSQYFIIGCTGGTNRIKWFNPKTGLVNVLPQSPAGFALGSDGKPWVAPEQARFLYSTPDTVVDLEKTQLLTYKITAGLVSPTPALLADFVNAVPGWSSPLPDWTPGSVSAGANITPVLNNATPAHSFQLVNGPCTTGTTYPNFLPATAQAPVVPGVQAQYVLTDGTCQWADMWVPPSAVGGKVTWAASLTFSKDDKVFSAALSNHGGQDGFGSCYLVEYNDLTHTYSHLNTCTGNVYNNLVYVGNVYDSNTFPVGRHNRVDMHSAVAFSSGYGAGIGFNNCALADVVTGAPLYCEGAVPGAEPTSFNWWLWQFNTLSLVNSKDWLGTGTPGHAFPGFKVFAYSNMLDTQPTLYQERGIGAPPPSTQLWDESKFNCSPNACFAPNPAPPLGNPSCATGTPCRQFGFDQHGSWVSNPGNDLTPIVQVSYGAAGGSGHSIWPPQYPWLGEVETIATDGSNRVSRQAYTFDSEASVYFNLQFNIGSASSDGNWWIMSSDWFGTLGSTTGTPTNISGLPYQANHTYSVLGETLGPIQYYAGVPGRIYKVVKTGTTDNATLPAAFWSNLPGAILTEGTAQFEYVGQSNAQPAVFILKLQ